MRKSTKYAAKYVVQAKIVKYVVQAKIVKYVVQAKIG